jgi:O-acetyl-ADP-ribose deacetylase (regulator of RNase III)
MQGSLKFVKGDATRPIGEGNKMLLHICNDENRWGAGFVLAVSRRWPEVERVYRASPMNSTLGANIVVEVAPNLKVVNMIAQHGIGKSLDGTPPIRYWALESCLRDVADIAKNWFATIHMPRIGCGLAGSDWSQIEPIVQKTIGCLTVYVYDL